jgi:hypothetical protein
VDERIDFNIASGTARQNSDICDTKPAGIRMSGIITFSEHEDWCGASYAFRHILTKVVEFWPPDGSASFKEMLGSAIDDGNNHVDLRGANKEDLEAFHAGVKKLQQIASEAGPKFLYDPDAYGPYMRWLGELEAMSRASVESRGGAVG